MFSEQPNVEDILCGTRTTSGTLITVPAGRRYGCNMSISASVAVAGNSNPVITVNGTNAAPAAGSVVARLNLSGLALTTVAGSMTIPIVVKAPLENSITIDFTAGASGTSSATVNGYLYD